MTREEKNKELAKTYRSLTRTANRARELVDEAYNAIEAYLDDWMIDHGKQYDSENHTYVVSLYAKDHSCLEVKLDHQFDMSLMTFNTKEEDYWQWTMLRLEDEILSITVEFKALKADFERLRDKAVKLHEELKK